MRIVLCRIYNYLLLHYEVSQGTIPIAHVDIRRFCVNTHAHHHRIAMKGGLHANIPLQPNMLLVKYREVMCMYAFVDGDPRVVYIWL